MGASSARELRVPLVVHRRIRAFDEAVETARRPRTDADAGTQDAAQALPAVPVVAVPPLMPHGLILPAGENVNAVRPPRDRRRLGRQQAAQVFPAAPPALIPLVVHVVVEADGEDVE